MINEIVSLQNQITKFVDEKFISQLLVKLSQQKAFINEVNSTIAEYLEKVNNNNEENFLAEINKEFHSKIFSSLEDNYVNNSTNSFEEDFKSLNNEYEQYLPTIVSTYKQVQADERFIPLKDDSVRIKYLKKTKNILYNTSQLPIGFTNFFRKLFKKPVKPKNKLQQNIPLKNLCEYFGKEKLTHLLLDEIEKVYTIISSTSLILFKACQEVSKNISSELAQPEASDENQPGEYSIIFKKKIQESISEIENIEISIKQSSAESIQKIIIQLDEAFQKAGTIELLKRNFNPDKIKKLRGEVSSKYKRIIAGWHNNLFALYDDWRLFEELNIVKYTTQNEYLNSSQICKNKIENFVIPNLNLIRDYLSESRKTVAEFEGSEKQLQNSLTECKKEKLRIINQ